MDLELPILDLVDDPEVADANPVLVVHARQLLDPVRARFPRESVDRRGDPLTYLLWQAFQPLERGRGDDDPISGAGSQGSQAPLALHVIPGDAAALLDLPLPHR